MIHILQTIINISKCNNKHCEYTIVKLQRESEEPVNFSTKIDLSLMP